MELEAVAALVLGTVLVLCIPAVMLSTDLMDRIRSTFKH
jgi:hypothetical protein